MRRTQTIRELFQNRITVNLLEIRLSHKCFSHAKELVPLADWYGAPGILLYTVFCEGILLIGFSKLHTFSLCKGIVQISESQAITY